MLRHLLEAVYVCVARFCYTEMAEQGQRHPGTIAPISPVEGNCKQQCRPAAGGNFTWRLCQVGVVCVQDCFKHVCTLMAAHACMHTHMPSGHMPSGREQGCFMHVCTPMAVHACMHTHMPSGCEQGCFIAGNSAVLFFRSNFLETFCKVGLCYSQYLYELLLEWVVLLAFVGIASAAFISISVLDRENCLLRHATAEEGKVWWYLCHCRGTQKHNHTLPSSAVACLGRQFSLSNNTFMSVLHGEGSIIPATPKNRRNNQPSRRQLQVQFVGNDTKANPIMINLRKIHNPTHNQLYGLARWLLFGWCQVIGL